jgi:hypothetical protein
MPPQHSKDGMTHGAINDLRQWCQDHDTDPAIIEVIIKCRTSWRRSRDKVYPCTKVATGLLMYMMPNDPSGGDASWKEVWPTNGYLYRYTTFPYLVHNELPQYGLVDSFVSCGG